MTKKAIDEDNQFDLNQNNLPASHPNWRRHPKGSWFAVILVIIGTLFLLNNFNLLPLSIWSNLWRLWPLILIIWGLQVLLDRTWLATLTVVIVTMIIVFLLLSYINPNLTPYFNHLFSLR